MSNLSRRDVLRALAALGLGGVACVPPSGASRAFEPVPEPPSPRLPTLDALPYESNLQALMDTLWPGALEVDAERVLRLDRFLILAHGQGYLPGVSKDVVEDRPAFDRAFARLLDADLDLLAQLQQPLSSFRELPLELRVAAVEAGYRDPAQAPLLAFVHAACVVAYYGAVYSDRGLVAVGFPEFEDLASGVAVSGYPRPAPDGSVDDYTFNLAPAPTPGDDLDAVLDAGGDLR